MQTALKIITLHTFFLSTLMSAGMLLANRKKPKNQIFFGLFLSFSLIIFYFFLYESKLVRVYPYLAVICLSGIFLIGPMTYFLAQYTVIKHFIINKNHLLHFVPACISLIAGVFAVYFCGYQSQVFYFNFFGNKIITIIGFGGVSSFIFYLVLTGKKLLKSYLWHFETLKNEPAALASFILFDIFIMASVTDTLALTTGRFYFLQVSMLLMCTCVILLFLLNLIYPSFEKTIGNVVVKETQKRSYLSNIDIKSLENKIEALIYSQEIYKDEHLTLKKLATQAGVSTHQLSEFINKRYQKNYSQFINEFRVNQAKKLLLKKPEFTVLAVAYEVGFHSKSSFNNAFRKITGLTPSQFKKANR